MITKSVGVQVPDKKCRGSERDEYTYQGAGKDMVSRSQVAMDSSNRLVGDLMLGLVII